MANAHQPGLTNSGTTINPEPSSPKVSSPALEAVAFATGSPRITHGMRGPEHVVERHAAEHPPNNDFACRSPAQRTTTRPVRSSPVPVIARTW